MKEKFQAIQFLPSQVKKLLYLSIFIGLFSFIAEFIFSQVFVLFFVKVGFSEPDQLHENLRFLIKEDNIFWASITFGILISSFCRASFEIINALFMDVFQMNANDELIRYCFLNDVDNLNLGEVNFFVSSVIPKSSHFINLLGKTIIYIIQATGLFFISLYMAPKLFLIIIGSLILASPIYLWAGKVQKALGLYLKNLNEQTSQKLMSSIKNYLFIKIIGYENKISQDILDLNQKNLTSLKKLSFLTSLLNQFPNVIGLLLMFVLFYNFSEKDYNKPLLISLFYLLYRLIQSLFQVMHCLSHFNIAWPNFVIYRDFLSRSRSTITKTNSIENSGLIKRFDLNISNLNFCFKESRTNLFTNLNCNLPEGGFLLLKGSSGSGKSTFLMLVSGILKKYQGNISWGGVDIREINLNQFKQQIGYVGPEPFLFSGSIRENLLFASRVNNISEEELDKALELADAKDFVYSREKGLNHFITESGEGLSMGQKQRISLARALMRKPKVLVLDEFTANLDAETEKNILQTIEKIKGNVTIVMASHSSRFDNISDVLINL